VSIGERRLTKHQGLEGVGFVQLGDAFNRWAYRVRGEVFSRKVRALALDLRQARVIDIGSGTGFYIRQWERLGAEEITGVDITQVAVRSLTQTFPRSRFLTADVGRRRFQRRWQPGAS
jgi:predicted RNA methylase